MFWTSLTGSIQTLSRIAGELEPGKDWSWCYLDEVAFVLDNVRGTTRILPSPLLK